MKQAVSQRRSFWHSPHLTMALFSIFRLGATNYDVDGDGVVDFALEQDGYQIPVSDGVIVHSSSTLVAQPGMVFLGVASSTGFAPGFDAGVTVPGSLIPRGANDGTVRRIPLEAYDFEAHGGHAVETVWGAALQTRMFICFRKTDARGTRYGWLDLRGSGPLYAKSHAPHTIAAVGLMPENSDSISTPPGTLTVSRIGSTVEVKWSGGRLEQATTVDGPVWGTIDPSVEGTWIIPIQAERQFFRVR